MSYNKKFLFINNTLIIWRKEEKKIKIKING